MKPDDPVCGWCSTIRKGPIGTQAQRVIRDEPGLGTVRRDGYRSSRTASQGDQAVNVVLPSRWSWWVTIAAVLLLALIAAVVRASPIRTNSPYATVSPSGARRCSHCRWTR